ncbi:hypothetical protein KDW_50370 [Dictyobacter vulcani]|uniref:Uncharacterized protein n=1 Tax=Dictyobacter vulcani TaxID=2607529 RepID=A0A5J4KSK9_9CHLR|nr:hypothetical protein [Dictyobacter vulcani]GER90875.1 hypothetical protein KDW_50370 [Dictyobacter vulcani]
MVDISKSRFHIGVLQIGIIVCVLATAFIHLYLALQPDEDLRTWFILNSIGYLVLLVALFLPPLMPYRRIVDYVLIVYTAVTIVMWFLIGLPSEPIGYVTKAIEAVLIILLVLDTRIGRKHSARYQ